MSIIVSNLLLCILLFFTSGGLLTLTLSLKEEDANMSSCIEKERQALLDVKASLIDLDGELYNWGSEEENMDCCKWVSVRCSNDTGHVIELDLSFYGFTGNVSPSLQVLKQLQYLALSDNDFQSNPLPEFLGFMSNLQRLDISGANLSGLIPRQLGNLSNLLHLDLGGNSLSGPIPHQLGNLSNLLHLDLGRNSLSGSFPLSFGDLTSLTYLDLSQNQLGGVIPKSFGNCSPLVYLDLSQNRLKGSLPDFTGCTSLKNLVLSSNFLSGSMPNNVGQLLNLETLDVSHNFLNGSLPEFKGFPSLWSLDLSSNQFFGNVSTSLGHLSNLEYLDFSSNSLKGVLSEVHFLNLTKLNYLDLSLNSIALDLSFHGRIPSQLSIIKLQSCKLGPRFPRWIKTQRQFKHLDISNAGISDNMPAWFWDLPIQLQFLNISSNEIEGTIPNSTTHFDGYPGMDLSNNHFEGRVQFLPSTLSALNLSGNRFSGTLSFLCDIAEFLSFLDLSNNSFSGTLPECWSKFEQSLIVLNLSNNNLSGKIPSSLGFLSYLQALYLRTNAFVGELPMSLSNCTRLRFLDLKENKLSGVIPEWIGEKISELYVLVLGSNRFYERLTSQVCWLHNLQVLDLSNNGLSGNIPRCFDNFTAMAKRSFEDNLITSHYYSSFFIIPECKDVTDGCPLPSEEVAQFLDNALVTWKGKERSFERTGLQLLKSIDLSRNNFSGKLPHEITRIYDLASLNISINKLHGEVPNDMGRLKALQSLDLSRNEFSGRIPWSLSQLNFLSILDLSYNNLSGRIPTGTQLQSFSYTSYSGNPQLCGPPLTPRCGLPPFVEKKDVEEDEDDLWKSYYTGMGVGFAVGFSGICGALFLNRRCRYVFFSWLSHMKDWIYVMVVVHFGKLGRKFRK